MNEEAINTLKDILEEATETDDSVCYVTSDDADALKAAIKALEQQPCEDAISREYVESIVEELENICINGDEYILSLLSNIKNAPPVTPSRPIEQEPRQGHWIEVTNGRGGHECDVCHNYAPSFQDGDEYLSAYCPNCGADMRESKEVNADGNSN